MSKILNKKGAIIFEVMAAVAIIGIVSVLVYTSFASMSYNAYNGFETRLAVEQVNKVINYFELIEDKVKLPSQTYQYAVENDNAFCTTTYTKENDIQLCKTALNVNDLETDFKLKVFIFNYDDRVVLNNIKDNSSNALLVQIESILNEERNGYTNPNFYTILIEVTSTRTNKSLVINKVGTYA